MGDRWYVGLPGGHEVWVQADEVRVEDGYLVLERRGAKGPSVALAAAPGQWTTLTPQPTRPAADFTPQLNAFCTSLDTGVPHPAVSVMTPRSVADRRRTGDRRRIQLPPGPGAAWNGIERRSGQERRAS